MQEIASHPAVFLVVGAAMMMFAQWVVRFWMNSKEAQARQNAEKLLSAHGLSAYTYLPSFSIEDAAIREALDRVALGSRIVLDAKGCVVGRVLPKLAKGPDRADLRLVVDNSK